ASLKWRSYYDSYQFDGNAHYAMDLGGAGLAVEDNRTLFEGRWVGTQLTDRFALPTFGTLTLGGEGKIDLTNLQSDSDVAPAPVEFLHVSRPDRSFALFAQDERKLSDHWT